MNNFGQAFGDSITTSKKRFGRNNIQPQSNIKNRFFLFQIGFIFLLFILFFQLINLTIIKGQYYQKLSSENRIREYIFPASRGIILDRGGQVLVRNKPGYIANLPCGQSMCYKIVNHEEAIKLEAEGKIDLLSFEVAREYIDPVAFSHIIGTTGAVNEDEVNSSHCGRKLTYEDELGRSGVEQAFDCRLQGRFGKELVEVDASGNTLRTLSKIAPLPGNSLTLSIDKNLQILARDLMNGKKGAVIVHIPQTGEILVLFSSPSYDLSKFVEGLSESDYQNLVNEKDKPLYNRALSGIYPPGSTFKTIVASGALEDKVIDKSTVIEDTGIVTVGDFSFANWYFTQYGKTDGPVNIIKAIQRSNDIFFYKVGESLGIDKISVWARKFKLGQKLGIEISGESDGLVPDKKWKEETLKEQWYLGDTYHISIGQGNLLVTPLQIAFANGAFGNNGIICKPTVLKTDRCEKITDKLVTNQTLEIVKQGMIEACTTGGTAYPFFDYKVNGKPVQVACKTGTSEFGDPDNKTHAWFTAFAPAQNPQIAVTVIVEGGGEGSAVAAPIAKELFNEWLGR